MNYYTNSIFQIIKNISILIISLVLISIVILQNKEKEALQQTLYDKVDSIKMEQFILETEVTRYRIALETLEQENPKAAEEFNKRLLILE